MVNTMNRKKFFAELVKEDGDRILSWKEAMDPDKTYVRPFDYSLSHGGSIDSFRYYNDYVVEISKKV